MEVKKERIVDNALNLCGCGGKRELEHHRDRGSPPRPPSVPVGARHAVPVCAGRVTRSEQECSRLNGLL